MRQNSDPNLDLVRVGVRLTGPVGFTQTRSGHPPSPEGAILRKLILQTRRVLPEGVPRGSEGVGGPMTPGGSRSTATGEVPSTRYAYRAAHPIPNRSKPRVPVWTGLTGLAGLG